MPPIVMVTSSSWFGSGRLAACAPEARFSPKSVMASPGDTMPGRKSAALTIAASLRMTAMLVPEKNAVPPGVTAIENTGARKVEYSSADPAGFNLAAKLDGGDPPED